MKTIVMLFVAAALTLTARADPKPKERWYVLMMQGQRVGWMKSIESEVGDRLTSSTEMKFVIKRGAMEIKLDIASEFVETRDGKPISMKNVQALGAMATTTTTKFTADEMIVTTETGDQKSTVERSLPKGEWFTPRASERYIKEQLAKDAKEISLRVFEPSAGKVVTVNRKVIEKTTVEAFGKVVPAIKWATSMAEYKGVDAVEYVDEQGEMVKNEIAMGGFTIEQLAADKDLALSPMDAPELLESTVVSPSKAIESPRRVTYAVYDLRVSKRSMPDMVDSAGQSSKRVNADVVRVTQDVSNAEAVPAEKLDAVRRECLAAVPEVKADDPEIVKLVERLNLDGLAPETSAEKIRRFVHGYIKKKDMSVGFATASEVARTKQGDCSEHAMLLAAMLRAAKVPSRVVSGLVYVDQFGGQSNIFGYHMWTQALLTDATGKSAWTNFDATLPDATPYDAAHIILSTSSLADGEMQNFLVQTAPLIGRLKIDVIETKH